MLALMAAHRVADRHSICPRDGPRESLTHAVSHADFDLLRRFLRTSDGKRSRRFPKEIKKAGAPGRPPSRCDTPSSLRRAKDSITLVPSAARRGRAWGLPGACAQC